MHEKLKCENRKETRRARGDQQDLQALCERCERLEEEHANFQHVSTARFVLSGYLSLVQTDPEVLDQ
jgi:hypothetical protein